MTLYQVGQQQFAIIDNELWVKAACVPELVEEETKVVKRHYKTKRLIVAKSLKRKPGKYSAHNPMPEEVKEKIRAKYTEGVTQSVLAKDFGVSSSTIMKVLKSTPIRLTTKNKEVNNYICVDGHEFKSKLPPGEVICPICHSADCELGSLNGEVKEEDDIEN